MFKIHMTYNFMLNPILVKKNAKKLPLKMNDLQVSVFGWGHFLKCFKSAQNSASLFLPLYIKYLRYQLSLALSTKL
jgi:hypothetical protein